MKKLILICLLALTYNITYAQEPTKQETMDWIAGKFRKYQNGSLSEFEKYDEVRERMREGKIFLVNFINNELTFEIHEKCEIYNNNTKSSWEKETISFQKINLSNITEISNTTKDGVPYGLALKGNSIFSERRISRMISENSDKPLNIDFKGNKYYLESDWTNSNSCYFYKFYKNNENREFMSLISLDSEPDIEERMIKAFNALAKFNKSEGPKEKY
jgi:hypothetical protein